MEYFDDTADPTFVEVEEDPIEFDDSSTIDIDHIGGGESGVRTINVLYCIQWSYRSTYDNIAKYVESKNPSVIVTGDEYPASELNQILGQVCSFLQFGLIAVIMIGPDVVCQKLGVQTPDILLQMGEKKFMVCMISFLIGNMVKSNLLSTGAFEIYFDDELVFSKLQTNEIPSTDVINELLTGYGVV